MEDTVLTLLVMLGAVGSSLVVVITCACFWWSRYRGKKENYQPILEKFPPTAAEVSRAISCKDIPFSLPPIVSRDETAGQFGPRTSSVQDLSVDNKPHDEDKSSTTAAAAGIPGACTLSKAYSLGSINPELYVSGAPSDGCSGGGGTGDGAADVETYPERHIGRLWFELDYERDGERLLVTIVKAKHLPRRVHGNAGSCDPYVRLDLMPEERRYLQSKQKKNTCNPKFHETFVFQVSMRALDEHVLKMSVVDVDRSKRHHVIGHVTYPLRQWDVLGEERVLLWRDLEKPKDHDFEKGEIRVSLCYNPDLERLTVVTFECNNMPLRQHPDEAIYIKVSLSAHRKSAKSKKTSTLPLSMRVAFNESFSFKVPTAQLNTVNISVTVVNVLKKSGKMECGGQTLGSCVFGSMMFARGKQLEHWTEMCTRTKQAVVKWHPLWHGH